MNRIPSTFAITLALVVCAWASTASAGIVNLIINGEFETPGVSGDWSHFDPASVPGWSTTDTRIEFWREGAFSSPTVGSDGSPTGQHLEINYDDAITTISQSFVIPAETVTTIASLTYDVWFRGNASGEARLTQNGSVVATSGLFSDSLSSWTRNSFTNIPIAPGQTWGIEFVTYAGNSGSVSPHIDQVEFLVDVRNGSVPTPATLALLGLGFSLFGFQRRRRLKIA